MISECKFPLLFSFMLNKSPKMGENIPIWCMIGVGYCHLFIILHLLNHFIKRVLCENGVRCMMKNEIVGSASICVGRDNPSRKDGYG